jgi:hypothetical protein
VTKLLQVAGKTMKSQKPWDFGVRGESIPAYPTLPKKSEKRVDPATYSTLPLSGGGHCQKWPDIDT